MKRKQSTASNQSSKQPCVLEPRRLAGARGGAGLGITVTSGRLPKDIMEQQHNEALVRL